MKSIILASQSPRRKQLLEQAEISFSVRTAHVNEDYPGTLPVGEVPLYIAKNKAAAVWQTLSAEQQKQHIVLAADTVVVLGNRIIGKPEDEADAIRILNALSGKTHEVVTGVVLQSDEGQRLLQETTEVVFRPLTKGEILHYVREYKPMDKAGAYAIQEWIGLIGIESIKGDYYNVVGLPVNKVLKALEDLRSEI
jgi:septum formation protein